MNQYRKYTLVISNFLLLFALIYFLLALFSTNTEKEAAIGDFSTWEFNENWTIKGDISQENVTLPVLWPNNKEITITLENTLPDYITNGMRLSMRTALQDARFYIDGILRSEYVCDNFPLINDHLPSAYIVLDLTEEDAGKVIEIELSMEESIKLNEIKLGYGNNLWFNLISRNIFVVVSSLALICGGLLANLFYFTFGRRIHTSKAVLFLGQAMIVIGLWILSESHIRQLIFRKPTYSAIFAYILCELIGGFVSLYFNEVQKHKYNALYVSMEIIIFGQALVNTILNFTGLVRFYDTLVFSHIWLILCTVIFIITLILDIRSKHIRTYSITAWGMLIFIVFCGFEMVDYYIRDFFVLGKYICGGLLVLLTATLAQTIHDEMQKLRMTTQLMKEKEAAENASQAKSEFLASMSHEIRTPINAVLGIDEMILRECKDPQILDYAEKIKTSGQNLLYLVNDILDISKIESKKMELLLEEYEPKQLFSEVLLMIEPRVSTKKLSLCCDIDPQIPARLSGDAIHIRQILTNLLTNAVKYTNEGKITFSVHVAKRTETEVLLHFSVKDTGIGIKEEDYALLFESFKRLDNSKTRETEGTGLGLSIAHKLLQLMDSDLCLQSIYGLGSDFHFVLKQNIIDITEMGTFEKERPVSSVTKTYHEGFYAPSAKILVVDDTPMNLVVFKGLLKNSGMHIQTAASGQEALEQISQESFDLVFMDHLMPTMDGIETLHHILENEALHAHAKNIIALTANAITGAKEFYLQEGFSGYLSKPIYGPKLEKIILEFLPAELVQLTSPADIPSENSSFATEQSILDQQLGISLCAGNIEIYQEVLKAFVQSNLAEPLQDYFAKGDWNNYRIAIHGIKSAAKSIGAAAFAELAETMELALKERNDIAFIATHHPEALRKLEALETYIQELLNK